MALKTILVHVDLSRHAPARIRGAASLARAHGAFLLGVAMTAIPSAERACGLLVMGCYGHARWRELCLGGASCTVLARADVPVLFAH